MRINPVYSYNFQTTFSGSDKQEKKLEKGQFMHLGEIFNSNYTQYARDDMNWQNFGKYLKYKYPDISEVDIKLFACSTGEEAYTMAMLLKHLYGNARFKIKAMDINEDNIEICKFNQDYNERCISKESMEEIQEKLDLSEEETKKFFNKIYHTKISLDILSCIEFKKANILTSLDMINPYKPTILMARNMWPYVSPEEYRDFAQNLYKTMSKNSVVVVGGYDITGYPRIEATSLFPNELYRAGFNKLYVANYPEMDERTRRYIYEK